MMASDRFTREQAKPELASEVTWGVLVAPFEAMSAGKLSREVAYGFTNDRALQILLVQSEFPRRCQARTPSVTRS